MTLDWVQTIFRAGDDSYWSGRADRAALAAALDTAETQGWGRPHDLRAARVYLASYHPGEPNGSPSTYSDRYSPWWHLAWWPPS